MGGLFDKPKQPKVQPPPVIPIPDDEEVRLAKKKEYANKRQSGRAGTIMSTGGAETLGGS